MRFVLSILLITFPFFALVLCGYLAARRGLLPQAAIPGLNTFVLSGYPHLEEAYRFAELVFPLLPRKVQHQLRGSLPGASLSGPFGEVVANNYLPRAAEAAPLQVSQS